MATTQRSLITLRDTDLALFFIAAISEHGPAVDAGYAELFAGVPAVTETTWPQSLQELVPLLEWGTRESDAADEAHTANKVTLGQLQSDRRDQSHDLRTQLVNVHGSYLHHYGEDVLVLIGLEVYPSRRMLEIRRQAQNTGNHLRTSSRLQEAVPLPGMTGLEPVALADSLGAGVTKYLASDKEVKEMTKQVDASMIRKNKANEQLRRLNVNAARVLVAAFRMVGMDELAERIRPFTRKRRRKVQELPGPAVPPPPDAPPDARP